MRKLIELLNEYRKEKGERNLNEFEVSQTLDSLNYLRLFIKWLVENDKIDLDKVEKKFYNEICITDYGDKNRAYGKSDLVISVLSISDTPIEDLISYLK